MLTSAVAWLPDPGTGWLCGKTPSSWGLFLLYLFLNLKESLVNKFLIAIALAFSFVGAHAQSSIFNTTHAGTAQNGVYLGNPPADHSGSLVGAPSVFVGPAPDLRCSGPNDPKEGCKIIPRAPIGKVFPTAKAGTTCWSDARLLPTDPEPVVRCLPTDIYESWKSTYRAQCDDKALSDQRGYTYPTTQYITGRGVRGQSACNVEKMMDARHDVLFAPSKTRK